VGNAGNFSTKALRLLALTLAVMPAFVAQGFSADRVCPQPTELDIYDFSRSFVQTRHLKGFDVPLVSHGTVSLKGGRVVWHVQSPFDVRTSIGSEGVTQSIDGKAPHKIDSTHQGASLSAIRALSSLLRFDIEALQQSFDVSLSSENADSGWTALLKPHDHNLMQFIGLIQLQGCETVDRVILRQTSSDDFDVIDILPVAEAAPEPGKATDDPR